MSLGSLAHFSSLSSLSSPLRVLPADWPGSPRFPFVFPALRSRNKSAKSNAKGHHHFLFDADSTTFLSLMLFSAAAAAATVAGPLKFSLSYRRRTL